MDNVPHQNAPAVDDGFPVTQTSEHLDHGSVYTRKDLRRKFGITDATLNNGVFQPKGHDSVWLFVTVHKQADRTQYEDSLDGNLLSWQGQTMGRTDRLIVEHMERGLELVLFFRMDKREHPGAGFRYEGTFRYQSHGSGGPPTNFHLVRTSGPEG